MPHPATEKRGGNPDVKQKPEREKPKDAMERKLEQGLEESMTGSDPVSVTQPPKNKRDEKKKGWISIWVKRSPASAGQRRENLFADL